METFTQLLSELIDAYNNGGMNQMQEYIDGLGLKDETKAEIAESFKVLDKFEEKRRSLELAKDQGDTSSEWFKEELDKLKSK